VTLNVFSLPALQMKDATKKDNSVQPCVKTYYVRLELIAAVKKTKPSSTSGVQGDVGRAPLASPELRPCQPVANAVVSAADIVAASQVAFVVRLLQL